MKFIVVTGGVISGLGKGITASSIGRLLKSRGYSVSAIKIDPYLNSDAGTMSPFQHGEVYVLEDGGEVDLDLGNYERFLDVNMKRDHNITTGKVYRSVIEKERKGEYLGKTVQIIPHITNEIKYMVKHTAFESYADIVIIEVGGTVGDIESMPFLEAVRQLRREVGEENLMFIHATLVPMMSTVGEQKTKPTQHSVKELRSLGIAPDVIIGRGPQVLDPEVRQKISLFCDVPEEAVISAPNVGSIYEVPLVLEEQGLTNYVLRRLKLPTKQRDMKDWKRFVDRVLHPKNRVSIAVVGKYVHLRDSYLSHIEAFHHAGAELGTEVNLVWIDAEDFEKDRSTLAKRLGKVDGVLVPGGFGERGAEGKMMATQYARENGIPFLGVCFGFQLAVVEFCRDELGLRDAHSTEIAPKTPYPVVDLLPEQRSVSEMGGTMRLGSHPVIIAKGTKAAKLYGAKPVTERHRHRYEINPAYIDKIEKAGFRFVGRAPDGRRMEIAELDDHAFFLASQFHPEFKSRPGKPSRLHFGLVKAALVYRKTIRRPVMKKRQR